MRSEWKAHLRTELVEGEKLQYFALEPFALLKCPAVAGWARATGDVWLQKQVEYCLRVNTPYHTALAVALVRWLADPPAKFAKRFAAEMLEGKSLRWIVGPQKWVHKLNGRAVRTIRDLTRAEIDMLHQSLDDATEMVDAFDWQHAIRRRVQVGVLIALLKEAGCDCSGLLLGLEGVDACATERIEKDKVALSYTEERRRSWLRMEEKWYAKAPADHEELV